MITTTTLRRYSWELGPVADAGWGAALRHWNHVAAEGEGLKWPELSM